CAWWRDRSGSSPKRAGRSRRRRRCSRRPLAPEPLGDVAVQHDLQDLLAVAERLIHERWIVVDVGDRAVDRGVERQDQGLQVLVEGARVHTNSRPTFGSGTVSPIALISGSTSCMYSARAWALVRRLRPQ